MVNGGLYIYHQGWETNFISTASIQGSTLNEDVYQTVLVCGTRKDVSQVVLLEDTQVQESIVSNIDIVASFINEDIYEVDIEPYIEGAQKIYVKVLVEAV